MPDFSSESSSVDSRSPAFSPNANFKNTNSKTSKPILSLADASMKLNTLEENKV